MGDVQYVAASPGTYDVTYVVPAEDTYLLDISLAQGGGLTAEYFNNRWLFDSPVDVRVDAEVNFQWGNSFITTTGKDYISVRWAGFVAPRFSEVYQFKVHAHPPASLPSAPPPCYAVAPEFVL